MKVNVRKRKESKGIQRLFLDIYNPKAEKVRTSKSLDLFVYVNPTRAQSKLNKQALEAAEIIRSQHNVKQAYENNSLGDLNKKDQSEVKFLSYFKELTDERFNSNGNYGNWESALKHLRRFCPKDIPINQIDVKWLNDFKHYLDNKAKTKSENGLSQNSKYSYFNKVKACFKQAYRDELILKNPADRVKSFKQGETQREFLTIDELKEVVKHDCEIPLMKTAFIFSCLTGLRWSDINRLTWSNLLKSEENGYWSLRFRQQKTKGVETLPISDQARSLLSEEVGKPDERIFKGLKYSAWHNLKLQQWMMKAGISKTITFHCARHTYATLQLSNGTSLYTVSKLLGHRELKTTQVYAKIIDDTKIKAASAIPEIEL